MADGWLAMMERDDDASAQAGTSGAAAHPNLDDWLEMLALGRFSAPLRDTGVDSVAALARLSDEDLEKSCTAAGMKPIQQRKVQKRLSLLDVNAADSWARDDSGRAATTQPKARRKPGLEPQPEPEPEPPASSFGSNSTAAPPEQHHVGSTVHSTAGFHAETPHQYLGATIMPRLMRALNALEAARPPNALEFIAQQLERAGDDAVDCNGGTHPEEVESGDALLGMGAAIGRATFLQYADAYFSSALLETLVTLNRERPPKAEACAATAAALRSAAAKFSPPEQALHGHFPVSVRHSTSTIDEKTPLEGNGDQSGSSSEDAEQADEPETTVDILREDAQRLEQALALLKQDEEGLRQQQSASAPRRSHHANASGREGATDAASTDSATVTRAGSPRRRPRSPQLVGREVPGELGILAHSNGVQSQGSLELTVVSGAGDLENTQARRKPRGLGTDLEGAFGHGRLDPS
eukprot:COSAG03_NODE_1754_length_3569_cov_1.824496_2_plen_467_part_00